MDIHLFPLCLFFNFGLWFQHSSFTSSPLPPAGGAAPSASPPVAQADVLCRWRELPPWTSCPMMSWKTKSPTTTPTRHQRPSQSRGEKALTFCAPHLRNTSQPHQKNTDTSSFYRDPLVPLLASSAQVLNRSALSKPHTA